MKREGLVWGTVFVDFCCGSRRAALFFYIVALHFQHALFTPHPPTILTILQRKLEKREVDARMIRALQDLPERLAEEACTRFNDSVDSSVRSRQGFMMGIIKRLIEEDRYGRPPPSGYRRGGGGGGRYDDRRGDDRRYDDRRYDDRRYDDRRYDDRRNDDRRYDDRRYDDRRYDDRRYDDRRY